MENKINFDMIEEKYEELIQIAKEYMSTIDDKEHDINIIKKEIVIMDLEKEIEQIKQRNKRVESDKAWETSWTRKICIMILTYIIVIVYSYVIRNNDNIFLSSLVPVIGFTLSTLSLKLIRKIWEKNKTTKE